MAAFAGTWDATSFVHTAKTDPNLVVDIIAVGTSFVLVITEAGQYTATATLAGQSQIETGTIRQVGSQLILTPVSPPGPEGPVNFTLLGNVASAYAIQDLSAAMLNVRGLPTSQVPDQ